MSKHTMSDAPPKSDTTRLNWVLERIFDQGVTGIAAVQWEMRDGVLRFTREVIDREISREEERPHVGGALIRAGTMMVNGAECEIWVRRTC